MGGILKWAVEGCLKWKKEGLKKPESVIDATDDYKTECDPTSLWIETRYTGNMDVDSVPTRLLFDDFMQYAREKEIQLPETYDTARFGRTIMKKYKSKPRRVDGSIAKHYFGFKLPN
jgi:putative DNA primase/helicase